MGFISIFLVRQIQAKTSLFCIRRQVEAIWQMKTCEWVQQQKIQFTQQFLLQMKNRVLQPSAKYAQKNNNHPTSQPKKTKYKLIMSINQLKKPVLDVVQSIFTSTQEKENIIRNKKPKSTHTQSHAEFKYCPSTTINAGTSVSVEKEVYGNMSESEEYKKIKEKHNFSEKVQRFFTTKKYNYTGNDEDNIDRLNAKLDKYISRYLGHRNSHTLVSL